MIIIGERINSSRAKIAEAIEKRNVEFIQKEAIRQVEAGADYLELNAGAFIKGEIEHLEWLIKAVQEVTDKPLCIDSANPEVFAATLSLCKGKTFLNSITAQKENISTIIPLLKDYPCNIVALCLGTPETQTAGNSRIEIASQIIGSLTGYGIDLDNIYIDPAIKPISIDPTSAIVALNTIEQIMEKYPKVHTICGVSNISFGLPYRKQINETFIAMAIERGLDTVIVDPCDKQLMANIITARLLSGEDMYCLNYINAYRGGKLPS